MSRAFRTVVTMLFVMLTAFQVRVGTISAVPITALPEAPATPASFSAAAPETAKVAPAVAIPPGPVHMFIQRGEQSRFELFFLDAKYGYDVSDFEFYNAWCLEKDKKIRTNALHQVRLYRHDDPDLPPRFKAIPWNQVNYLINHKEGSKTAIQDAIWYLADNHNRPTSPEAMRLIEEAALKGRDYLPGDGELVAVICYSVGQQTVFIELPLPEAAVVDAFPVSYAPPPPPTAPGISFLPPWLPLLAIPMIPPFAILMSDNAPDSSLTAPPPTAIPAPLSGPIPDAPPPPPDNPVGPIPEPSSVLLLGTGLAGLYAWGRIKRRA